MINKNAWAKWAQQIGLKIGRATDDSKFGWEACENHYESRKCRSCQVRDVCKIKEDYPELESCNMWQWDETQRM